MLQVEPSGLISDQISQVLHLRSESGFFFPLVMCTVNHFPPKEGKNLSENNAPGSEEEQSGNLYFPLFTSAGAWLSKGTRNHPIFPFRTIEMQKKRFLFQCE